MRPLGLAPLGARPPAPLTRGGAPGRYVEEEIDLYSMEQRATKLREAVNSVLPDRFAALREHVHVPHVQVLRGSEAPVPAPSSAPDAAPDLEGSAPSGGEAAGVDASRVKVEIGDSGGAPPAPVPSCPSPRLTP